MTDNGRTVWAIGLNKSVVKTVVFEDKETAQAHLGSSELDLVAEEIEFVPSGKSTEWLDLDGTVRNYDQSKYEKTRRSLDTGRDHDE